MTRRLRSISSKFQAVALIIILLAVWQSVSWLELIPSYMLPSPAGVVRAFVGDFDALMEGARVTLWEAVCGLFYGITGGYVLAIAMDRLPFLYKGLYPILLLTQTIPTIAIAPLLVLWMGYGPAPKITLVFLVCFFPITIGVLDGFRSVDTDAVGLLRSMGANTWQVYRHIKLPSSLPRFFSGLKIAVTYAVVGAVIAEWLGGNVGLGVYMTRVRKSYSFDKMFAVIFFVSALSILLIKLVEWLERRAIPYLYRKEQ